MREILFRGKRIDNGEWVCSGNLIHFNEDDQYFIANLNEKCISTHDENDHIVAIEDTRIYKVIPETVGQYTGLTDKNGKKIFEGDIIAWNNGETDINGTCFDDELFSIEFSCKEVAFVATYEAYGEERLYGLDTSYTTVIGNIHDNLELLKGGG